MIIEHVPYGRAGNCRELIEVNGRARDPVSRAKMPCAPKTNVLIRKVCIEACAFARSGDLCELGAKRESDTYLWMTTSPSSDQCDGPAESRRSIILDETRHHRIAVAETTLAQANRRSGQNERWHQSLTADPEVE